MKSFKNIFLSFIVFIIFLFSFALPAPVLAFSFNPISLFHKTADIVVSRVSDIIYYLIMQKRYIFDDFTDPNTYSSLDIPADVEDILISSSTKDNEESIFTKPVVVEDTILPEIKNTKTVENNKIQEQQIPQVQNIPVNVETFSELEKINISDYSDSSKILTYTNQERRSHLLSPLIGNSLLDEIANLRADDLFANQYFEHISPDGNSASDIAKEINYDYLLIGENLALGNFDGDQGIVTAWMESPGHRANILNDKFKELGVAVKEGVFNNEKVTIAVQIFALSLDNCSRPNKETKEVMDNLSVSVKQMQNEALIMYNDLTIIKNGQNLDRSYYNQKIAEYNYFAKKVNDAVLVLKNMIDIYNADVAKYNVCINVN